MRFFKDGCHGGWEISPINIKIFLDSGASIFSRHTHLSQLHLTQADLIPCHKKVTAIGGSSLSCKGWLPRHFMINNHITKQLLHFCDKITCIYFSHKGCIDLNNLSTTFPYQMATTNTSHIEQIFYSTAPTNMPGKIKTPTEETVPKLEKYL